MSTRLPGAAGHARVSRARGAMNGTAGGSETIGGSPDRTSLSFTEEMKGFYADNENAPGPGENAGRETGQSLGFRLTITVDDVERFLEEPEHTAQAEGWIDAVGCGGRRQIERGWFNLFSPGSAPDRRLMRYRLHFTDAANRPRTLSGWKDFRRHPATRGWPDTTTLFFRMLEGHVPDGGDDNAAIVGAGILRLGVDDFARQLTTFRTSGPHGLAALERFAGFFLGELWDLYRPRLGDDEDVEPRATEHTTA